MGHAHPLHASGEAQRPFANLLPLVDALLEGGNALVDDGFVPNPDGWRCRLTRPIDFDLVRDRFEIPDTIQLSPEHDTILDRLTWCSIEGPAIQQIGARPLS